MSNTAGHVKCRSKSACGCEIMSRRGHLTGSAFPSFLPYVLRTGVTG